MSPPKVNFQSKPLGSPEPRQIDGGVVKCGAEAVSPCCELRPIVRLCPYISAGTCDARQAPSVRAVHDPPINLVSPSARPSVRQHRVQCGVRRAEKKKKSRGTGLHADA